MRTPILVIFLFIILIKLAEVLFGMVGAAAVILVMVAFLFYYIPKTQ